MNSLQKIPALLLAASLAWASLGTTLLAQDAPAPPAPAPAEAVAPKDATIEQRVTDLEQYFQNLGVGGSGDTTWTSKIANVPGPGHNGFMMICAALVLFMTLPGLALFYGGLVRKKNVLSVLAQCLGITGLVTILWFVCGYSFVFGDDADAGGTASTLFSFQTVHLFLDKVGAAPDTNYSYWISGGTFSMYQLMFAIITPALIIGAIAERMKYAAVLVFIALWMFAVYFPMAHAVWGIDGMMNGVWNAKAGIKAIDFAGGTVVHMTSGWSALVLCLILGKRLGFAKEKMAPHSMVLCMVGTGMLWVGWYGFNAGSALAADGISTNAFVATTLATATAGFVWALVEWIHKGKPSILGFCSGIVAGLVVITPACGFVSAKGSMIIGVLAGVIPYIAVVFVKGIFGYDDALDTFGVHGVGGTLGAIMTGILATPDSNGNLNTNLKDIVGKTLVFEQLKAVAVTILLSVIATAAIAFIVKLVVGLRPTPEVETSGLDVSEHGEEGYIL
jgi:Amt family ammonium transporter